jgi:hypothetical protein
MGPEKHEGASDEVANPFVYLAWAQLRIYVAPLTPLVTPFVVTMPAPVGADGHIACLSSNCDSQEKQHDPEIAHGASHLLTA